MTMDDVVCDVLQNLLQHRCQASLNTLPKSNAGSLHNDTLFILILNTAYHKMLHSVLCAL